MKRLALVVALLLVAAVPPEEKSLRDKVLDLTIQHLKTNGPDSDVAQVVSMMGAAAWARRAEFAELAIPHLGGNDPAKAAGALEVLYRLRHYHPMSYLSSADGGFEKDHADFFGRLDWSVLGKIEPLHRLNDPNVFHHLALYLGSLTTPEAKRELWRIARETPAKEQALICLTWHRDPADLDALLPFVLEDSRASAALPYHLRNSYGKAALPYLRRAAAEAKAEATRRQAEKELEVLRKAP